MNKIIEVLNTNSMVPGIYGLPKIHKKQCTNLTCFLKLISLLYVKKFPTNLIPYLVINTD